MSMQAAGRLRTDRARPRPRPGDLVAATLAGLAGALHLWLTPAYAAQGARLAAVFLGLALGQLAIAVALALAPGPAVRAIGRWGSLALAVVFLAARVVPLAWGDGTPERLGRLLGPLSLLLEIGALAALALLPSGRGGAGAPRWAAGAIALVYVVLQVIASGGVIYARRPFPQVFSAAWRPFGGDSVAMYPGLHFLIGHHWSVYLPLAPTALTLVVAGLLGRAVGLTIRLMRRRAGRGTQFGLLGVLPAGLAAPLCCGPSLLAAAGVALPGLLGFLALPLLALSGLLLLAHVAWLRRRLRRLDAAGCDALPAQGVGPIVGPRRAVGGEG